MKQVIIIDASVAAKWLLPNENDFIADTIKRAFGNRKVEIAVPVFIFYEVNNLLKSAALSNRISFKDSLDLYENFLDLNFYIHSSKLLLKNTLQTALEFEISSYDASYIALAEYLQIPFYTADLKLLTKVKGNKHVRDLKTFTYLSK